MTSTRRDQRQNSSGTTSLSDTAYLVLRRDIILCELVPGQQVTEAELSERYKTGRAPVRAALSRLLHDGLVQVQPRQGYLIAPVTLKRVLDLVGVRLLLEPPAMRMAMGNVSIERLRALDEHYRSHFHLESNEHLAKMMEVNTEFHLEVARASGNHLLIEIIGGLLDEMERLFHLGFRMRAHSHDLHEHHHADMIDALARGDADEAERLMREQILATQQLIMDALISSPTLQSVNVSVG